MMTPRKQIAICAVWLSAAALAIAAKDPAYYVR